MMYIYVAAGGAIGAVLRYFVSMRATDWLGISFPYGTLIVNILGSFIMGAFIGYLAKTLPHSMELRAFVAIGILGGFTTFSAFSLDAVSLIENGHLGQGAIYIISSVLVSILALFAGLYLVRAVV